VFAGEKYLAPKTPERRRLSGSLETLDVSAAVSARYTTTLPTRRRGQPAPGIVAQAAPGGGDGAGCGGLAFPERQR
jgi:hypothetical protein